METIKKFAILFVLLVLPYLMYNYISKGENSFVKLAVIGTDNHKIPAFSFVNQDSVKVTNADYDDNIYIANFIFTTCPTICPTMTYNMRYVQKKLSIYPNIKFLSHTVNPKNDTPARLNEYAKKMKLDLSNWNLVTGDKDEIYTIAESYYVNASKDSLAPGGFLHSQYFILVDKQGRVRSGYSNFVCKFCGDSSNKAKIACPSCRKEKALVGNPVGSYDGTQDYVIKDLIKDVKTLLAEYHKDAKAERHVE